MADGANQWRSGRLQLAVVAVAALTAWGAVRAGSAASRDPGGDAVAAERVLARHYAPTPVPDRVVLTWTGDPATSVAVTWRTSADVRAAVVEIAPASASPDLAARARRVVGTTASLTAENGVAHHHSVVLDDLAPNTLYAYRVGGGAVWSEWFHHRTASSSPEPFSFLYFGDAQNEIRSLWSRAIRRAFSDAPAARFMVHAGDLVNLRAGNHDSEWGEWFGAGAWLNAMVPSIPATGNHEHLKSDTADVYSKLSPHWRRQFTLPAHGPPGLEGTVYHIDYQGVRIIVLNSLDALNNGSAATQAAWLEERLRGNPNRWTIVTFHHPLFSTREGRDNAALREHWQPLFDRYGVDLVLQGHDHAYGRGQNLPHGVTARDGAAGPVYVVSVSGPKMYALGEVSEWADRRVAETQLYQVIHVDGDRLRYEARTVAGAPFDAFDLVKRAQGGSMLIERDVAAGSAADAGPR